MSLLSIIVSHLQHRRLKRAISQAVSMRSLNGKKYLVLNVGGRPTAVAKSDLKRMILTRRFVKGTTMESLEQKALFITKP